ncbi:c-type cytochrome [Roseicyclus sp.]|uniref:c-type cytochrome n=1 Tax=Roseicyclus sp. TaxID=1914329 RepID=UPI003FA0369C
MLDTMTVTKAFGALCGALLIFLLGNWFADSLYSVGGHGEDHARGYVIIQDDEGGDEAAEEVVEVAFADVYAAADAAAGERLWRQCQACHALEAGQNGVGPYLHGVVNRAKAAAQGFNYSDALASMGGEWTPENLSAFIENPRGYAPGTAMAYSGMRDVEDRANLIAYLDTFH